jgi:hypothetical protein
MVSARQVLGLCNQSSQNPRIPPGSQLSQAKVGQNLHGICQTQIPRLGTLACCPIPLHINLTVFQTLLIAIEAAFTVLFPALLNRKKSHSFPNTCPQPSQSFQYHSPCSHNPLLEAVKGISTTGAALRKAQKERDRALLVQVSART